LEIVLENIQKAYGKRTVVNHASLSVAQGEVVGLLGANGAGKTTLFHIAIGLEKPHQGTVWLGECNITDLAMHQRANLGISYLPQEASIFRHLTVRDNILLILEQSSVPQSLRHHRLDQLLREFRLEPIASTPGIRISGGERRRTEIARALASGKDGPKFLLLDEPFAGVDPMTVAEIQAIISHLRDRQLGILITDHNVRETLAITDRAYIMQEGEILAAGNVEDLYENPFVRQHYLGKDFRL